MLKKILISIMIILTATINILFAGEEVNNLAATLTLQSSYGNGYKEGSVDFIASGTGKYLISFDLIYENIIPGFSTSHFSFGIEGIRPSYYTAYYNGGTLSETLEDWMNGNWSYWVYVDLEEGENYTLYASYGCTDLNIINPTITATHKFIYEREFMVSLPFDGDDGYFNNINDNFTFNTLMNGGSGSYFDFTGYVGTDNEDFNFYEFHPNFQFGFQGTINDVPEISPQLNTDNPSEDIYFQEAYHPYYNPHPFFQNCSNAITYLGDFEMIDNQGHEAHFGDRMFNFEYAPNYENLSSHEISIMSSLNCHPLLQWTSRYSNFFLYNGLENYFRTVIERRKYGPTGNPLEGWNVIATISPCLNHYEDTELESPDPDPDPNGTFGIEGTAKYRIILQQTPANPNYNANWTNNIWGYSPERSILYGQNGGGLPQNPMLFGVQNFNVIGFNNPTISFIIKDNEFVNTSVIIYNIRGQMVKSILDETLGKGKHTFVWDGTDTFNRDVSTGLYIVNVCRGHEQLIRKVSILR